MYSCIQLSSIGCLVLRVTLEQKTRVNFHPTLVNYFLDGVFSSGRFARRYYQPTWKLKYNPNVGK